MMDEQSLEKAIDLLEHARAVLLTFYRTESSITLEMKKFIDEQKQQEMMKDELFA